VAAAAGRSDGAELGQRIVDGGAQVERAIHAQDLEHLARLSRDSDEADPSETSTPIPEESI
jgi:hypothetical protein